MRSFNLFRGELGERRDQPGFTRRRAAVARELGAEKISAYELDPASGASRTTDMAVYPDSGNLGVWSGYEDADPGRLFRIASEVDHWDGEG